MSRGSPPLIGITADVFDAPGNGANNYREPTLFLPQRYCDATERAGAVALILPANHSSTALGRVLSLLDGLIISGGNFDIHPRFFGEKPIKQLRVIKSQRTEFELELTAAALKRDLPILGICGGAQAINVVLGGSLYQDIGAQLPGAGEHEQGSKKLIGGHYIRVQYGTRLHAIVRRGILNVNTTHHQAVKKLGRGLVTNALAEDGVIEGIESTKHRFCLGLQWHPEVLATRLLSQRRIFSAFAAICKGRRDD